MDILTRSSVLIIILGWRERIYDRRESTGGIQKDQINLNFTEHLSVTQSVNFYIKLFLVKLDSL